MKDSRTKKDVNKRNKAGHAAKWLPHRGDLTIKKENGKQNEEQSEG